MGWSARSKAPSRIVLSFRGTASMQNVLSDFQVRWLTFPGVPHRSCMPLSLSITLHMSCMYTHAVWGQTSMQCLLKAVLGHKWQRLVSHE